MYAVGNLREGWLSTVAAKQKPHRGEVGLSMTSEAHGGVRSHWCRLSIVPMMNCGAATANPTFGEFGLWGAGLVTLCLDHIIPA